jgi:hypothetical protein
LHFAIPAAVPAMSAPPGRHRKRSISTCHADEVSSPLTKCRLYWPFRLMQSVDSQSVSVDSLWHGPCM